MPLLWILKYCLVALTWSSTALATAPCNGSTAPIAVLKNGTYTGVYSEVYDQDYFLGVPFAQPPVGNFRFSVPHPLNASWDGSKSATEYSASCIGYGGDNLPYPKQSEDCLYLNVVRPAGFEGQELPVAFWIHGGGLSMGSSIDQRYNLSFIVDRSVRVGKPVIGVSVNYRVSMWGFITGDEVISSGNANLGFRDQRLALHWVQENIQAFGGDPAKVTIWGESAGGLSVGMHLTAYGGRDDRLFRGGIMQSGAPVYYGNLVDYDRSAFAKVANSVGCNSTTQKLQCLREVPFKTLNDYLNGTELSWQPVIDGDFIQETTSEQLKRGEFVKVPVISGVNSDEGTAFGPKPVASTEFFLNLLKAQIPAASATKVLSVYPATITYGAVPTGVPPNVVFNSSYGAAYRRSAAYYGDYSMASLRRLTCETWATFSVSAYCYRFNTIPNGIPPEVGATHFQEVAFVFDNKAGVGYPPQAADPFAEKLKTFEELADRMSEAWVSFVHDGNPGCYWPRYSLKNPENYVFDANVTGLGYAESDTWRRAGIELMNSWNKDVYKR